MVATSTPIAKHQRSRVGASPEETARRCSSAVTGMHDFRNCHLQPRIDRVQRMRMEMRRSSGRWGSVIIIGLTGTVAVAFDPAWRCCGLRVSSASENLHWRKCVGGSDMMMRSARDGAEETQSRSERRRRNLRGQAQNIMRTHTKSQPQEIASFPPAHSSPLRSAMLHAHAVECSRTAGRHTMRGEADANARGRAMRVREGLRPCDQRLQPPQLPHRWSLAGRTSDAAFRTATCSCVHTPLLVR